MSELAEEGIKALALNKVGYCPAVGDVVADGDELAYELMMGSIRHQEGEQPCEVGACAGYSS